MPLSLAVAFLVPFKDSYPMSFIPLNGRKHAFVNALFKIEQKNYMHIFPIRHVFDPIKAYLTELGSLVFTI